MTFFIQNFTDYAYKKNFDFFIEDHIGILHQISFLSPNLI